MKFNDSQEQSIFDISSTLNMALRRYWRISLGPSLVLFLLVILLGFWVKDYYESTSLIYIQPQRFSSTMVEGPQKDEMKERLLGIVQEILTRPKLRNIIDEFHLYPYFTGTKGTEKAIARLRNRDIRAEWAQAPTGEQLFHTFLLSYTHEDPNLAYKVTDRLTKLFIEESTVSRRFEVQGTVEFLDAELATARKELEVTEDAVQKFIRENFGQLPQHLEAAIARLENARARLANNTQVMAANMSRRKDLEKEMSELKSIGPVAGVSSDDMSGANPYDSLAQLEQALAVLQSKYSDQHPDVKSVRQRIIGLKAKLKSEIPPKGADGKSSEKQEANNVDLSLQTGVGRGIRKELRDLDSELAALENENKQLKETTAELEKDIQAMPIKEQELLKIQRNYNSAKATYDQLLTAKKDAGMQQNLIQSQKAPQFRIIEQPEKPVLPAGPNRWLLVGGGILFALVLFFGIPFGLFFLNHSYKAAADLEAELQIPVLSVIPPMLSSDAVRFQRRMSSSAMLASLLSFIAGCVLIFWTL